MSAWEQLGQSDDWRTPKFVFDALGCTFNLDVAAARDGPMHVPAERKIVENSLESPWSGFLWMNPPFGGRNAIVPWLDRFFTHGDGIALTPDRTSCPWWQSAAAKADAILFVAGKIRFLRPDNTTGNWPSTGTTLFAAGAQGERALERATQAGLGTLMRRWSEQSLKRRPSWPQDASQPVEGEAGEGNIPRGNESVPDHQYMSVSA